MGPRINVFQHGAKAMQALNQLGMSFQDSTLGEPLLTLVIMRISQINGCAMCIDMHSKDLRAMGETEQRIYGLDAWDDTPYYTDRERAALAWGEAVNDAPEGRVPDAVFQQARAQFSEKELIELTMAVIVINGYNRINIAFKTPAGDYKPGQWKTAVSA
jgi:AhpD family alkylhydroperoxidase